MVKKSLLVFFEKKQKNTIMSRKSKYKCKKCGYATDIYEGRGFMGQHIEAITCSDCHNIVPLVVGGVIGDAAPQLQLPCRQTLPPLRFRPHTPLGSPHLPPLWRRDATHWRLRILDVRSQPFFNQVI